MKLGLNGCKVSEDVGVVELKVIKNSNLRSVVQELRALIEKGGVVFVGLKNKGGARPRKPRRDPKVFRHAPHQKPGRTPAGIKQVGNKGGGCRLAVGASHCNDGLAAQQMLGEKCGARGHGKALIENGFNKWQASTGHIAHNKKVGLQAKLVGLKAFNKVDAC